MTRCLTVTETILRFIRDGEKGGGGGWVGEGGRAGGGGQGVLGGGGGYGDAVYIVLNVHRNFWRERRAEAESGRGPSDYQPNA